ncbi:hypothetical protein ACFLR7_04890 [Acidobacteriota bacterium]
MEYRMGYRVAQRALCKLFESVSPLISSTYGFYGKRDIISTFSRNSSQKAPKKRPYFPFWLILRGILYFHFPLLFTDDFPCLADPHTNLGQNKMGIYNDLIGLGKACLTQQ